MWIALKTFRQFCFCNVCCQAEKRFIFSRNDFGSVFRSIKERGQLINLLEYTDAYFLLGTSPSKLINENARIRTIPLFGLENEPVTVLLAQQNYTLHRNAQRFVDIFRQVTENI